MTAARRAAVVGSSGLVGGQALAQLLAGGRWERVVSLVRRPSGRAHPKLAEVVVDFDRPETLRPHLAVDDVFSCLGTTIRKAGSQAAFRTVDHDYALAAAREALAAGAARYLVVTAVGADPQSRVFYNRVKGELEAALARLAFAGGIDVFRPSLILGERAERRPAEAAAQLVMGATGPLFVGGLQRWRAIAAADVARAMLAAARSEGAPGLRAHEGAALFALAQGG